MTFKDKYSQCETWQDRVIVMELFHLAACHQSRDWTLTDTAAHFEVSIGLVSENLKLAKEFHENAKLIKCESRQEALRKIR